MPIKNQTLLVLSIVTLHSVLPVSAYKPGEYPGDPKIQPWLVERWEKACKYMNKGNELEKKEKTTADFRKTGEAYRAAKLLYPWDFRFEINDALHWQKLKARDKDVDRNRHLIGLLLQNAVFLCPTEWSNWNALANEYYLKGQLNEAKPLLQQALSLNPPKEISAKLKANLAQIDAELVSGKTDGSCKFKQQVETKPWSQEEKPVAVGLVAPQN